MNYLKSKDEFLNTEFLKEAFENDITWGGSLLGRLINSTIRKAKIGYKYTKVNSIVKQVEDQINNLLNYYGSEEDKKRVSEVISKLLIEEVYKVSNSDQSIEEKINILLGDKATESLIDTTISEVEKTSIDDKETLLEKLRKFKDDLLKLKEDLGLSDGEGEKDEEEGSDEEEKSKKDSTKVFYINSKSLLESVCKIHRDIKNNTVKFQSGTTGAGDKLETRFDEEKYKKMRTLTLKDLDNKIEMAKKAVNVYTSKNNKERINFYNNEIKLYQSKLDKLKVNGVESKTIKSEYDVTADKRAREELKKMHTESIILEEIDSNLRDQESDAKAAWNKVINAYNKSGISKYIPYIESIIKIEGADKEKIIKNKKSIMDIGRQVVINYNNVGKPISYQELISEQEGFSTSDVAKAISLFGRVLLSFSEDMGLLGAYGSSYKSGGSDAGGAGNHIKLFINSFNVINKVYPSIKKESNVVMTYQDFKMIREAQDDEEDNISLEDDVATKGETTEQDDKVKKSWFKFFEKGEEKKWKVDEKSAKDLNKELEDKPLEIDTQKIGESNMDPIIRIANLFGRAYDLYATDYIPSGRPNGRISQKTLREYEYIGKSNPPSWSDTTGPGFGPWASKVVYDKWQDGITKILENKQYRRILANTKFVSEAEKSTGTEMKKPGSGKTLFAFINDLLTNDEGNFKKHRRVLFEKYFNIDPNGLKDDSRPTGGGGNPTLPVSDDDKGDTDKPYFGDEGVSLSTGLRSLNKNLLQSFVKVISGDQVFIIYPFYFDKGNYVIFRYQNCTKNNQKQSLVTDYLKSQRSKSEDTIGREYKTDLIGMSYDADQKIGLGLVDLSDKDNKFSPGNVFKFKSIPIKDAVDGKFDQVKDVSIKVSEIKYLVSPVNDKKGKQTIQLVKFKDVKVTNRNDYEIGKTKQNFINSVKK